MNRWFSWFGTITIALYLAWAVPLLEKVFSCQSISVMVGKQCALEVSLLMLPWSLWVDVSGLTPWAVLATGAVNVVILYSVSLLVMRLRR